VPGAADLPTQVGAAVPAADATQVLTGVGAPAPAPATAATPAARPEDEEERRVNPWLIGLVTALVLAAALVAWLLLRNGSDDVPPDAPASSPTATATTATPSESATQSPTAETFDLDESAYIGRDVDEVLADLRAKGLDPRSKEIANPGDQRADSVAAVSPTKGLQEGDRVEVAYYGEPRPTRTPTTQEPTTTPPTTTAPTTSAPPTPSTSTPQTAETTSTTTADASTTPAAREDTFR
jgi:serine/threonine-protein kinase